MGYDSYGSEPPTSRYDRIDPHWLDDLDNLSIALVQTASQIDALENLADSLTDSAECDTRKPCVRNAMVCIDSMIESLEDTKLSLQNI